MDGTVYLPDSKRWLNLGQVVSVEDTSVTRDRMSDYGGVVLTPLPRAMVYHTAHAQKLDNPLELRGEDATRVLAEIRRREIAAGVS